MTVYDPLEAYAQRFRRPAVITRAQVAAAASLLPRQQRPGFLPFGHEFTRQSSRRYERERWYLSVSPGTVRVHSKQMAPKESLGDNGQMEDGRAGKPITEWSSKSRAAMTSVLPSLDYSPMFASNGVAAMITLTLPGYGDDGDPDYWERLVPDLPTYKRMLNKFQLEYKRAWGSSPVAIWKMEFQRRGAPHLHLYMVPPTGYARGRGVKRLFPNWLSLTWAKIVGAPPGSMARMNHELGGTAIDYREGARFSDPRRIAVYFSKHGAFNVKEYQNHMPAHWREAIQEGRSGGARFWGYWQLSKAVETIELRVEEPVYGENTHYVNNVLDYVERPSSDVVVVMRHLRKLARSRSYVKPVVVDRWKVDAQTGELTLRRRKVNRRQVYLKGRRSGFLVVNDGPSTALDIARLLGAPTRKSDYDLVS